MKKGDKVYFNYGGKTISGVLMQDDSFSADLIVATQSNGILVVKRSDLRTAFNFGGVFDSIFPWAK